MPFLASAMPAKWYGSHLGALDPVFWYFLGLLPPHLKTVDGIMLNKPVWLQPAVSTSRKGYLQRASF